VTQGWREPWWIPDESPGGIGDPEVWIDAGALDNYGGKNPQMVASVLSGNGGGPWVGALLRFGRLPDGRPPQQVFDRDYPDSIIYMIVARQYSHANAGRPYYVARVPD
jgi:hypothetical protein